MARADFNWVPIKHNFTTQKPSVLKTFPIEGLGNPLDDGFLLIQARGVSSGSHRVFVNDQALPGLDIPKHDGWQTWVDRIPEGTLHSGENTIRIERIGQDEFRVEAVVVNWREFSPSPIG